jgi:anti-sigma factor RsiW
MNGSRDIELLSSHLDGQLNPSDSTRLVSRLNSDPALASAYQDLRAARNVLRRLPARKAPRNFTLTRKMVGAQPPMPRSYSFFRFSSALATVLLVMTFAFNVLSSGIGFGAGAPAAAPYGAGGGGPDTAFQEAATEAPAAAEEPTMDMVPLPTGEIPPAAADSGREFGTPTPESAAPKDVANTSEDQDGSFRISWQSGLLLVSVICGVIAFAINRSVKRKWR